MYIQPFVCMIVRVIIKVFQEMMGDTLKRSDLLTIIDYIITMVRDAKDKEEILEKLLELRESIQESAFDELVGELLGHTR